MAYNPNGPMNDMMRRAGGRSRSLSPGPSSLPNIGQTPAVQAANAVMGAQQQMSPPAPTPQSRAVASPQSTSPMAAPPVQPSTFMLHPPGTPADPNQYTYEPQPNGAWLVYPPGVQAPPHTASASLPRAASTADYRKMRDAFQQMQPAAAPNPLA